MRAEQIMLGLYHFPMYPAPHVHCAWQAISYIRTEQLKLPEGPDTPTFWAYQSTWVDVQIA